MSYSEPAFTEFEERYLMAEIIKKSDLPPILLVSIIRDAQIEPQWTEIALPYAQDTDSEQTGRSLSSCRQAFLALQARAFADPNNTLYKSSISSADLERANAAGRELQPRPLTYPPFSAGPTSGFRLSTLEPPPRKKRGRPSKEEFERRAAEARARGEEYPQRRIKLAKRSAASPTESGASPSNAEAIQPLTTNPMSVSGMSPRSPHHSSPTNTAMLLVLPPPSAISGQPSNPSSSTGSSHGKPDEGMQLPSLITQPTMFSAISSSQSSECVRPSEGFRYRQGESSQDDQQRPKLNSVVSSGPSVPHSQGPYTASVQDPYGFKSCHFDSYRQRQPPH